MIDTEDLFRLYRPEWVIVHSVTRSGDDGRPTFDELYQYGLENYDGRVDRTDLAIDLHTDNAGTFWGHLKMLRPNMKGEFRYAAEAVNHATKQGWKDFEVVARNSSRDHELRHYGLKKLA